MLVAPRRLPLRVARHWRMVPASEQRRRSAAEVGKVLAWGQHAVARYGARAAAARGPAVAAAAETAPPRAGMAAARSRRLIVLQAVAAGAPPVAAPVARWQVAAVQVVQRPALRVAPAAGRPRPPPLNPQV